MLLDVSYRVLLYKFITTLDENIICTGDKSSEIGMITVFTRSSQNAINHGKRLFVFIEWRVLPGNMNNKRH